MLLLWTSLVLITRVAAVPIPRPEDYQRNATYDLDKYVCVSDDLMFRGGEIVPSTTPCHQCICRPPSVECELIPCEKKVGCRTLQLSDQCCPQYQCECESNGRIYNNGEKLEAPESPCQVCYCRGGQIVCTLIQCYQRDDCKPQQVPGRCCPKYDHCPPIDNRISNLHHLTGWPTMVTTSFLPESPSTTLGQRQHPSVTSRHDNTIFFETSASNRFELLGEPPQDLFRSSFKTTDSPHDTPGAFTILGETFGGEYSTERIPTSIQHSSNPSAGEPLEKENSLLVSTTTLTDTGAVHDKDSSILEGTTNFSEDSTKPPTVIGEAREGEIILLAGTTTTLESLTKHSTGTGEVHNDSGTPLEVTTNYRDNSPVDKHKTHEEDTTPAVENTTFLENPSTVKEEVHSENSTHMESESSSGDSSTVTHKVYEEDSIREEGTTTFSKYPSMMKEDKLEDDMTHLQEKTTSPEGSLKPFTVKDEARSTESSQSQDITIYPEDFHNNFSEIKRYNDSRITSLSHKIGTTEGFGNVRVTLIKFQRKTTLSPLTDFATERTLLPSESQTNTVVVEGETPTTQHFQIEDFTVEHHRDLEGGNKSESNTERETTTPLDKVAQESEYSLAGKEVSNSESTTEVPEIQNNISLETSQDASTDSITNGSESSVIPEVIPTESSETPTSIEKVASTYSVTSSIESQRTTDASDHQTSGDGTLGSMAGGSLTEIKTNTSATIGSLPQGDEHGVLVADKSEETWEHHRPTQMVTDEIQYITTVNPVKDHSEGENVLFAVTKNQNEPHSQHTGQTVAPSSFTKPGDKLSTRFDKLGETEYTTTSQPKEEDLSEPSYNTESDMSPSWDTTEHTEALYSEDISKESVTTNTPSTWNGYDESDASTRYVKLGEVVSQTGPNLIESEETNTDHVPSDTPKYIGTLESEHETTTRTGEVMNDQQHGSFTTNIESQSPKVIATENETTISTQKVQSVTLNNISLTNENTKTTENALHDTHTTVLPVVSPHVNSGDHTEKSKEDTIQPVNDQPSTFIDTHNLPTTPLDQDNVPLPIFKLSEEMSNHQMVVEIHHITSATTNEDSAEETMLNKNDPRDKVVIEEHTNKYPGEFIGHENNNTTDRNVSMTEEKHSSESTVTVGLNETLSTIDINKENGEDGRITTDALNEPHEHTTTIDVLENTTNSLKQQGATGTVSTELQLRTESEIPFTEKPDVPYQTDFDDTTAQSVTESEVAEATQGKVSTTLENVTSQLTSQDVEREITTENGETSTNLDDEHTEDMFERQEGGTTMGNTEAIFTATEISEDMKQSIPSDESQIGTTEGVVKSLETNMTNAEISDMPTDVNSSSEEYTLPPQLETTSSLEGNQLVTTGNEQSETSTLIASSGESQETTHNIPNVNNISDVVNTDPVISETNTEQEPSTHITENIHTIESNTELAFTTSLEDTTDNPVTTTGHDLNLENNTTDTSTPSTSLTGIQQDTSEIDDTLRFQSNKTEVGNTTRPEHDSTTEIELQLKFQSNKTKDQGNNDTVNGTANVNFVHALPTGWLKDEDIVNSNQSEGYGSEQPSIGYTQTPGDADAVEYTTFIAESSTGENHTPKISTVDAYQPDTVEDSGTRTLGWTFPPEDGLPEESIYTRLQREDAEELGKYDLETLQNFFKNLYIQDDHAHSSSNS